VQKILMLKCAIRENGATDHKDLKRLSHRYTNTATSATKNAEATRPTVVLLHFLGEWGGGGSKQDAWL